MMRIDGSRGEGGGQIIRTALTLAMVTGQPVTIDNVRAGRPKPGLLRQHLTALHAAKAISNAEVTGDELGSRTVVFAPRAVRGGAYRFDIGSAGSAMLVVQTLLPALLRAREPSVLEVSGGTHNPMSPPFPFFETTYLPLLRRMGANVTAVLDRAGFYPAGGGRIRLEIEPCAALTKLVLEERGAIRSKKIRALTSRLPQHIAKRELAALVEQLDWHDVDARPESVESDGPGNVLLAVVDTEHVTEVFSGFGERGLRAEDVAARVAREARAWLEADVPVGPHLADQLVLPMALGAGGSFRTLTPSGHLRTQVDLLRQLLGRTIDVRGDRRGTSRVDVAPSTRAL